MKAGFFTSNNNFSKKLVAEFLQFGVTVYQVKELKDIYSRIKEKNLNGVFLDITNQGFDWIKFIRYLRNKPETQNVVIVLYTDMKNEKMVKEMVLWGINGIFETSNPPLTSYVTKIQEVVEFLEKETQNKRKYVRVRPDKDETMMAELKIPNHISSFKGTIEDISIVSAAVKFPEDSLVEHLSLGEEDVDAVIDLGSLPFEVKVKLLRVVDNTIVIEFTEQSYDFKESLVDYIFHRVNL